MYKLEITKSVLKDFQKTPSNTYLTLLTAIENLATNPFPESQFKKLKGTSNTYRLRVGNYRIVYIVESKIKLITVYRVRHRKDVYKK